MALTVCPECGGTVSTTAETCPHCGYSLINHSSYVSPVVRDGYDVMLIDYDDTKFFAKRELAEIVDCSASDANTFLSNLPAYLYNDITLDEARLIAEELKECDMRCAVYWPNGNVEYYEPDNYNRILPSLIHVSRKPWRTTPPPRPRKERYPGNPGLLGRLFGRKAAPKAQPKPQPSPMQNQPRPAQQNHASQARPRQENNHPAQARPNNSRPSQPKQNYNQSSQPRQQNNRPSQSNQNYSQSSKPRQENSRPSQSRPNNSSYKPNQSSSQSRPSSNRFGSSSSHSSAPKQGGNRRSFGGGSSKGPQGH